jgi:hypothetical protein
MVLLRTLPFLALLFTATGCDLLGAVVTGDDPLEVEGTVEQVGDDFLVVGGHTYAVTEDTEFDGYEDLGSVSVGDLVEIEYTLTGGDRVALRVENEGTDGEDDGPEVQGTVEAIGPSSLVVAGETYLVTEGTEFDGYGGIGDVEVGDEVEVEYVEGDGGTRLATEIEYLGG